MGKIEDYLKYLNDERGMLWEKTSSIEKKLFVADNQIESLVADVQNKTSDYEASARQASKKASEYRNRSEEAKDNALKHSEDAKVQLEIISDLREKIEGICSEIYRFYETSQDKSLEIDQFHIDLSKKLESIAGMIEEVQGFIDQVPDLENKVDKLDTVLNKSEDYNLKADALYKSIAIRKKEIDELYYDIIGFIDTDSDSGEESVVAGKKAELENVYTQLQLSSDDIRKNLADFQSATKSSYLAYFAEKQAEFSELIKRWETENSIIKTKIESLLPNALTTGLSFAYSEKRAEEIKENIAFSKTFNYSILGLIVVSLIPFGFSWWGLHNQRELKDVLLDMPRLVLAILPLYIPILWVAYSTNIRIKLSKRLIEEYTHKEVLSKTYEGLAKQISDLSDNDISADLRNRLLYNMLEVSSENPGKLITDYNKSDHPLMDALDKSVKLAGAVDKLAQIPGFSRLTQTLEKRSRELIRNEDEKAAKGLDYIDATVDTDESQDKRIEVPAN